MVENLPLSGGVDGGSGGGGVVEMVERGGGGGEVKEGEGKRRVPGIGSDLGILDFKNVGICDRFFSCKIGCK